MRLHGSCHCGAVKFRVDTQTPYPYLRCYCSICRKTGGGGGYAINIMGDRDTLEVTGKRSLGIYRARIRGRRSEGRRHFCRKCGSALWSWDARWPDWVYPLASAIDTPLPKPKEVHHIMLNYAAPWVDIARGKGNKRFAEYPSESIEGWHRKRGLYGRSPAARKTAKGKRAKS